MSVRAVSLLTLLLFAVVIGCDSDDDPAGPTAVESGDAVLTLDDFAGNLVEGAAVLVHDSRGALRSESVTNSSGQSTVEIDAGDWVTARLPPEFGGTVILTLAGARPGDDLQWYGVQRDLDGTESQIQVQGMVPAPYDVVIYGTPCSSGAGSSIVFPFETFTRDRCGPVSGLFSMSMYTQDGGVKQAYNAVTDLVLNEVGTTTTDFDGAWRTDWQDIAVTFPDPGFAFTRARLSPWPERAGVDYYNLETWDYDGPASLDGHVLRMPRDFFDMLRVELGFDTDDHNLRIVQRVPVSDATTSLVIESPTPRLELGDVTFDASGWPVLEWTVDRDGLAGDFVMVGVSWSTADAATSWSVFLPPDARSFRFPEVPDGFVDVAPGDEAVTGVSVEVMFQDDSLVDGFAEARTLVPFRSNVLESAGGQEGSVVSTQQYIEVGEGPR